jgi:hypothetical protein
MWQFQPYGAFSGSSNWNSVLQTKCSETLLVQQSQPSALEVLNAFFDALSHPSEARLRRPPEVTPRLALAPIKHLPKFHLLNEIAFATHVRGEQNRLLILGGKIDGVVGRAKLSFEFDNGTTADG